MTAYGLRGCFPSTRDARRVRHHARACRRPRLRHGRHQERLEPLGVTKAGRNVPGLLVPKLRKDGSRGATSTGPTYRGCATASRSSTRRRSGSATASTCRPASADCSATRPCRCGSPRGQEGRRAARRRAVHRRAARCVVVARHERSTAARSRSRTGTTSHSTAAGWCSRSTPTSCASRQSASALDELAGYLTSKGARSSICTCPTTTAEDRAGRLPGRRPHRHDLWALVRPDPPETDAGSTAQPVLPVYRGV